MQYIRRISVHISRESITRIMTRLWTAEREQRKLKLKCNSSHRCDIFDDRVCIYVAMQTRKRSVSVVVWIWLIAPNSHSHETTCQFNFNCFVSGVLFGCAQTSFSHSKFENWIFKFSVTKSDRNCAKQEHRKDYKRSLHDGFVQKRIARGERHKCECSEAIGHVAYANAREERQRISSKFAPQHCANVQRQRNQQQVISAAIVPIKSVDFFHPKSMSNVPNPRWIISMRWRWLSHNALNSFPVSMQI